MTTEIHNVTAHGELLKDAPQGSHPCMIRDRRRKVGPADDATAKHKLDVALLRLARLEEQFQGVDADLPGLINLIRQDVLTRHSYERFLPPHLVRELAAGPGKVNLEGVVLRATVLFKVDPISWTALGQCYK